MLPGDAKPLLSATTRNDRSTNLPRRFPGMIGLDRNRPSSQMRGWSMPAAWRFKRQPDRKRSCNPQIAIELQRSAGSVAPCRMAKIDFDVITDIAAKRKIDSKSRILHADVDTRSSEDQPHDSEFGAACRHA